MSDMGDTQRIMTEFGELRSDIKNILKVLDKMQNNEKQLIEVVAATQGIKESIARTGQRLQEIENHGSDCQQNIGKLFTGVAIIRYVIGAAAVVCVMFFSHLFGKIEHNDIEVRSHSKDIEYIKEKMLRLEEHDKISKKEHDNMKEKAHGEGGIKRSTGKPFGDMLKMGLPVPDCAKCGIITPPPAEPKPDTTIAETKTKGV